MGTEIVHSYGGNVRSVLIPWMSQTGVDEFCERRRAVFTGAAASHVEWVRSIVFVGAFGKALHSLQ